MAPVRVPWSNPDPMAFLNPWMLLGLGAIGVPIAIHLLNRFRPRRVPWAAMELLRRAAMVRQRRVKIEDLILLALRCLAIALFALALARPTLTSSATRLLGGTPDAGVVIALDVSYSMGHRSTTAAVHTRFDRAVERTRQILGTLEPGSPVTLVTLGDRPRVLYRNSGYREDRLDEILRELEPRPETLNLDAGLALIEELAGEIDAAAVEAYLVSDAQARQWERAGDAARAALGRLATQRRLFIVPTTEAGFENLALTRFELAGGLLRRGAGARYVAEVANFGVSPQHNVAVRLLGEGGIPGDQQRIGELAPGERATVSLATRFDRAGVHRLRAEIDVDALEVDNRRYAVAAVRESVRVLLVDGEPADAQFDRATGYIEAALAPASRRGTAGRGVDVERLSWLDLTGHDLSRYDLVVLANIADVRESQVEALRTFASRGGGVVVMLGDRIEPSLYNARLAGDASPLLPARIGAVGGDAEDDRGERLAIASAGHPITRVLDPLPGALWDEVRIWRWFELEPVEGARVLLTRGGEGAPVLVEHAVGRGRVLLFAGTANVAWTNLMLSPVGPVLLHQAVTHLTRRPFEGAFRVGRAALLPIDGEADQVTVTDPRGEASRLQVAEVEGQRIVNVAPEWPGFYEIAAAGGIGEAVLAVNVDAEEGDAASVAEAALRLAMDELPGVAPGQARVISDEVGLVQAIRESRVGRELWRGLVIAALAVLVIEALLARWFTQRSRAGRVEAPAAGGRGVDLGTAAPRAA
ncbi:MAG: BatA domain-containing protein [Phycisphaeraceae bacterium]